MNDTILKYKGMTRVEFDSEKYSAFMAQYPTGNCYNLSCADCPLTNSGSDLGCIIDGFGAKDFSSSVARSIEAE